MMEDYRIITEESRSITEQSIQQFEKYLVREEKSMITIAKYIRDVRVFARFVGEREVTKELSIAYKKSLENRGYAIRSINSMLVALNCYLKFMGWSELKVKTLKLQKQIYCRETQELQKQEYLRLITAARDMPWLKMVIQTIGSTGIRISELRYFTMEAVKQGEVIVKCKNKTRTVLVPGKLRKLLLDYGRQNGIQSGGIFVTRTGNPLDRSYIWAKMKMLCDKAEVSREKVFPHNLRKLFARLFYKIDKDIAKLADILGHSSIETTRIYIMTSGTEHRRKLEEVELLVEEDEKVLQWQLT